LSLTKKPDRGLAVMSVQPFESGAAAGRRWAARNRGRRERILFWALWPIDAVSRFPIYATCFTDQFNIDAPVAGRRQHYSVPMLKAERLADAHWSRFVGWPRGAQHEARFVEGFVHGAVSQESLP
jgi:hypothetical protein